MSSRSPQSRTKSKFLRTFTYFIPAPPQRRSGYREREFDKIMQGILQSGFELVELRSEAVGGETGGLFILAVLRAPNAKVDRLDRDFDLQEKFKLSDTHSTGDIELEDEDV